jgi:cation:H+ antiporter
LAREAGVGDAIIGLTLVAIGTSLPELAASLSLARRSQHAILLGNLVGSNIFNMLLVGGITGAIFTFKVPPELFQIEYPAMLILTGLLWLLTLGKSPLGKAQGFLLITLYLAAIAASTVFHG